VVDNTNASVERRAGVVALAHRLRVPVRAIFVDTPFEVCEQRNARRTGRSRVPDVGLRATAQILVPPNVREGFDSVEVVSGLAPGRAPGSRAPTSDESDLGPER
jgi:predicted kinase